MEDVLKSVKSEKEPYLKHHIDCLDEINNRLYDLLGQMYITADKINPIPKSENEKNDKITPAGIQHRLSDCIELSNRLIDEILSEFNKIREFI